jgi:hypothetical protein
MDPSLFPRLRLDIANPRLPFIHRRMRLRFSVSVLYGGKKGHYIWVTDNRVSDNAFFLSLKIT